MTQVGFIRIAILAALSLAVPSGRTVAQTTPPVGSIGPTTPDAAQTGGARGRGGRGGAARVVPIPDAPPLPHAVVENPLPLPPAMTYGVVASVAVNSAGHVFVYHRGESPLVEFDATGRFVGPVSGVTATRAHSVRIDADDNIWLVDVGDHTVTKFDPQGRPLMTLGTKGVVGSGDADAAGGRFNLPSDVGIAPNGDIFISQGEAAGPDPRIIHFDRTGQFLNTWSLAFADGPASDPHALAVGRDGLVYVADRRVMRVRVFRPDGTPVRDIQLQNLVCGIDITSDGRFWISTGTDGLLLQVDPSGHVTGFAGRRGTGPGELGEAHMVAAAPNGDVYVADTMGQKVVKFAAR